jgi:hypothetical protein
MAASFSRIWDHRRVVKIAAADVDQLAGLLFDCCDNLRVTVTGCADCDAGGEVEEAVAVHIFDHRTGGALDDERVVAGVRGRAVSLVALDQRLCLGTGKRRDKMRRGPE